MKSKTLLLCLCGLVFMLHGNLAVAQKPAYNEICHALNHNVQSCWPTNVGEQCDYCHEDAVFTESMMSWDNCAGKASGRCANQGFPVCCYDPFYSNPTKLRLAFWWKAGTSCASMGKTSCTDAKGKGNPLSAIIIEERARTKMYKQEQREKKRSSRNLRATRQLNEENVGGGRVYGEYNEGPYTAGAEYNWDEDANVGGHSKQVMEGPGYTWDEDANDDVGGGRVYGEYNEGPYKAGAEYNWDEEEGDESVGGWVSTAGGLIWKDMDRGVANGECNGRCQRRLRAASRSRQLKKKAYLNKMLTNAVKNGNIRKVKRLLSQGADVNAYVKDGENEDKKTALLTAIQYSPKGDVKVAMVKLLLKSGANPNKRSSKWLHSALELSVWYDLFAETSKLLLADPRTNPNLEDYQGNTALSIAISNGMQRHAALIMRDPRTRV
jgi:hypothetical protein